MDVRFTKNHMMFIQNTIKFYVFLVTINSKDFHQTSYVHLKSQDQIFRKKKQNIGQWTVQIQHESTKYSKLGTDSNSY